jgi:hypothetical protein
MATTTKKASVSETWPTGDDYTRALAHLSTAAHAVDVLSSRLHRLVEDGVAPSLAEGAAAPQLRDIGNLFVFTEHAALDVRQLKGDVEQMAAKCRSVSLDEDYFERGDDV